MTPVRMLIIAGLLLGTPIGCAPVSKEAFDEAAKPVSKEFLLGPEDVLEVSVWRNQDLSRTVVVRPDGRISLPLIGDIQASGLNASQVAAKIAAKLAEFKENPNVSVSLKEVNSYFIFVLGEVHRPGKYPSSRTSQCSRVYPWQAGSCPLPHRAKCKSFEHVQARTEKRVNFGSQFRTMTWSQEKAGSGISS